MNSDAIANFINSLKNASSTGKELVIVPFTNIKKSIADLLKKHNFISSVDVLGEGAKRRLSVKVQKVNGFSRVSKFSRRVYGNKTDFKPVKNGSGIMVVTTSQGIMSGEDAQKAGVGGEMMFKIW